MDKPYSQLTRDCDHLSTHLEDTYRTLGFLSLPYTHLDPSTLPSIPSPLPYPVGRRLRERRNLGCSPGEYGDGFVWRWCLWLSLYVLRSLVLSFCQLVSLGTPGEVETVRHSNWKSILVTVSIRHRIVKEKYFNDREISRFIDESSNLSKNSTQLQTWEWVLLYWSRNFCQMEGGGSGVTHLLWHYSYTLLWDLRRIWNRGGTSSIIPEQRTVTW